MSDLRIRSATAARAQAASVVCGVMDLTIGQAGPNVAELLAPRIRATESPRIRRVDATVSLGGFTHG